MKKISFLLLSVFAFISPVFADTGVDLQQFLSSYVSVVSTSTKIPDSRLSIQVKYTNIPVSNSLYKILQKAIYLDIFPNASIELPLYKQLTKYQATKIVAQSFAVSIDNSTDPLTLEYLHTLLSQIDISQSKLYMYQDDLTTSDVYKDVLARLSSSYYYQTGLSHSGLIYGAIQGLVDSIGDPYTSFFPPTDADQFEEQLQGEYVGIGAYVEMSQPGVFIISATMDNSPAQKAGLLAGDQIITVDGHEITNKVSLSQAINWVKGKEHSQVTIVYLRQGKEYTVKFARKKVVVPNIQSAIYTGKTQSVCVLTLRMFPMDIASLFESTLSTFQSQGCDKYIFDLRNNPGGSLEELSSILNYFVPTDKAIVSVKTRNSTETLYASDTLYKKLTDKNIRILINGGSASAAEIFAAVIREYIPTTLLVGQQSFGKGSVQDLISYQDGSLFKYTMAKRYTGKDQINIDQIGLTPDVNIEDKVGTGTDAILDWALKN